MSQSEQGSHDEAAQHREDFVSQMRMVPGSVALICTANEEGRAGLVATAWNSLSADPPTLLSCVNREASAHNPILASEAFSVNLLAVDSLDVVEIFSGQRGLSGDDRFLDGNWSVSPGGQPYFRDALASFECRLEAAHMHSTHTVLIGLVEHMQCRDGEPLIYLDGKYCRAQPL